MASIRPNGSPGESVFSLVIPSLNLTGTLHAGQMLEHAESGEEVFGQAAERVGTPLTRSDPDRYDFFVSYARADDRDHWISRFVAGILAERQLTPFFDTSEIHSGDDWDHRIRHAVAESRVFLAFVSPNYLASPWCEQPMVRKGMARLDQRRNRQTRLIRRRRLPPEVYEKALLNELALRGIPAAVQALFPIACKGHAVGDYIADIVVENQTPGRTEMRRHPGQRNTPPNASTTSEPGPDPLPPRQLPKTETPMEANSLPIPSALSRVHLRLITKAPLNH